MKTFIISHVNPRYLKMNRTMRFKNIEKIKIRVTINMVPKVRIELTADPYQGPVLPLNYIGIIIILIYF